MTRIALMCCGLLLVQATATYADACIGGGGVQRAMVLNAQYESQRHNFAIERDPTITKAKLIIPGSMLPQGGRNACATPAAVPAGVSMACCLVVGGLCLARVRRHVLLAVAVPMALAVLTTTVAWANAPPPAP